MSRGMFRRWAAFRAAARPGAVSIRVEKNGLYQFHKTGAVQSDVGKVAYLLDDNTVSTAATTNSVHCGVVGALIDGGTLAILIDGRTS